MIISSSSGNSPRPHHKTIIRQSSRVMRNDNDNEEDLICSCSYEVCRLLSIMVVNMFIFILMLCVCAEMYLNMRRNDGVLKTRGCTCVPCAISTVNHTPFVERDKKFMR